MPRFCNRCNRPLTAKYHDIGSTLSDASRGRGRVGLSIHRTYGCRTKLIATNPVTDATMPARSPQRSGHLDTRYTYDNTHEGEEE